MALIARMGKPPHVVSYNCACVCARVHGSSVLFRQCGERDEMGDTGRLLVASAFAKATARQVRLATRLRRDEFGGE